MNNPVNTPGKPKIGITIGDVNGIGPEVIIKALSDHRILNYFTPVIYGSEKVIAYYRKTLKTEDFAYSLFGNNTDNALDRSKINIFNCWKHHLSLNIGTSTKEAGAAALKALDQSVQHLREGVIDAVVTAPINKANIQSDEFDFPGHTEFFAAKFQPGESLMLLTGKRLRIGVVTGHIPLNKVSAKISKKLVLSKLKVMTASLRSDFGISKPKIAVLGLNPHAGDSGLLGKEDDNIIKPVIMELKSNGHLIFGPFPADGFFGRGEYKKFDAVMAMYHDQGLIPFKTLEFGSGVNFTAGLPIIRTSPDHGTAYNIAGKNEADPNSIREAIFTAYDIFKNRKEYAGK